MLKPIFMIENASVTIPKSEWDRIEREALSITDNEFWAIVDTVDGGDVVLNAYRKSVVSPAPDGSVHIEGLFIDDRCETEHLEIRVSGMRRKRARARTAAEALAAMRPDASEFALAA